MFTRTGSSSASLDYKVGISSATVVRDLGFYYDETLNFSEHSKVLQRNHVFSRYSGGYPLATALCCYKHIKHVRPIVEASSTVFSPQKEGYQSY